MSVFKAVTKTIHLSPRQGFSAGHGVFASVSHSENRGQTPGGQPLDLLGALSLTKRQAATVPGGQRAAG